ncbi:hypothetical protein [Serratia sp. BIGb0163]|uniref:hypothetical protein n=1 Tax=Serratia sp. BIGb0163 TaxID=2940613 RepID=UPI002168665B|nr:hypothetical protein [Serratia sp. BIGb0163]MCS4266550.1 hypothetical protein [Serratia sp. BIGb0163]
MNNNLENDLVNEPDATRLIFGLRDTGYNVKTASADIIDNSIAADADQINIEIMLHYDGRKKFISVITGKA